MDLFDASASSSDGAGHVHGARATQVGTIALLKLRATDHDATGQPGRCVSTVRVRGAALRASDSDRGGSAACVESAGGGDADGLASGGGPDDRASSQEGPRTSLPGAARGDDVDVGLRRRKDRSARRSLRRVPQTALQREAALTNLMGSCLRRAVGVRTRADSIVAGSLSAHLVGSATSAVRAMLCVVGPSAVDLAALWFSEDGSVLCSCWEHTQNVALLRLTGKGSSCWHARCFSKAMEPLEAHREELESTMRVKDTVDPHAVLVELPNGCAAVAYDGEIFSPVVASKKRYIKCISVGCRSTQRRCQHATLVRALPRFCDRTDGGGAENDSGEDPRDTPGGKECESPEGADAVDDEALVAATLLRARRNLVACMEEDKLCEKWARSAD